ncbi:HD domain-containing protein [uncultured Nitrosomonas sp.]|uniref:HD domain-containing protein n=1 Tax=uncultured Nitrosomonas sp. TaxID=156424 RepID=UPI0025FC2127|nr:HD domain-containing protein [uncultured Nitrosomonas sp.]
MSANLSLVEQAKFFAIGKHRRINQRRKYSYQPYEIHLKAVAKLVSQVTGDKEMVAAAWLHDVVEDTAVTFEDLEHIFGQGVTSLVRELTDVSRYRDGNRCLRKQIDREHIARASDRAKTIKLADLIDNCEDICSNDPKFGRVYLDEMKELLNAIEKELPLYKRAFKIHSKWDKQLSRVIAKNDDSSDQMSWWFLLDKDKRLITLESIKFLMTNFCAKDIAEIYKTQQKDIYQVQIVSPDSPLTLVVSILAYFEVCYIEVDGQIKKKITRDNFESPIAKTWLAGIIILYDQTITDLLQKLWNEEELKQSLSPGRLEKAEQMIKERERRGKQAELIDCLQFSDKFQTLMKHKHIYSKFGYSSASAIKRVNQELESLRNNIAHGQSVTKDDWAQIVRLSERLTEIVNFSTA